MVQCRGAARRGTRSGATAIRRLGLATLLLSVLSAAAPADAQMTTHVAVANAPPELTDWALLFEDRFGFVSYDVFARDGNGAADLRGLILTVTDKTGREARHTDPDPQRQDATHARWTGAVFLNASFAGGHYTIRLEAHDRLDAVDDVEDEARPLIPWPWLLGPGAEPMPPAEERPVTAPSAEPPGAVVPRLRELVQPARFLPEPPALPALADLEDAGALTAFLVGLGTGGVPALALLAAQAAGGRPDAPAARSRRGVGVRATTRHRNKIPPATSSGETITK